MGKGKGKGLGSIEEEKADATQWGVDDGWYDGSCQQPQDHYIGDDEPWDQDWSGQGEGDGSSQSEPEKELGSLSHALELSSLDISTMDLSGFCTASGEIIEEQGNASQAGYSERGRAMRFRRKLHNVHKPLVSMSQVAGKGNLAIMTSDGGSVIEADSIGGRLITAVLAKIRNRTRPGAGGELLRLYNENGVYNFYLQCADGTWKRYNLDSGAAATVFPVLDAQNEIAELATETPTNLALTSGASVSGNRGPVKP